ncbi:glycosyltransferase [Desulfohalovibrio reitneri]|uniref:glycosyltransferase n=1 Tax=Desulfohalovibrio reitneri TaxID=1307759 RepID=UPI0004A75156|nr:glycosyltransferase [Desulfohalovibrio reitneri]
MRVCLVSLHWLLNPLREAGHEAICLDAPERGDLHVAEALEREGFKPDAVVVCEHLGRRFLPRGLDGVDCPVAFWGLDTHLNFFWQRRLAPLFDLVLTTQPSWVEPLRQAGSPLAENLPWLAFSRPWRPWAERTSLAAFVGRLSAYRPARSAMVELLQSRFDLATHSGLLLRQVQDAYLDARLVPNETIAAEANMRLFEGAASGCLVFSPAEAVDQELFFEPGEEFIPYHHGLDLLHGMEWARANPDKAEAMGRAAWERSRADHMPANRAARLVELLAGTTGGRTRGAEAERLLLLARMEMWRGGRRADDAASLARELAARPDDPDCAAGLLSVHALTGKMERGLATARDAAASDALSRHPECALAASALSQRAGDPALARFLLERHRRLTGQPRAALPQSPQELWTAWAGLMRRAGLTHRPGFAFDSARHLPACQLDCLVLANQEDPADRGAAKRLEEALRRVPGSDTVRAGLLSGLSLHQPDDWRTGMELGLANLRIFRVEQGLEELALARDTAREAGRDGAFASRLRAADPSGSIRRALTLLQAGS